jgi:hypothetical protein
VSAIQSKIAAEPLTPWDGMQPIDFNGLRPLEEHRRQPYSMY